jgi:predicted branched-subunit amino acid permease
MAYAEPGRDLGFLGTLAVLALIAQAMRVRLAWPVVIAATVVALIGVAWPHRAGMLLAVLAGVVTPLVLEARARAHRSAP